MKVVAVLDAVGTALLLQLCFAIASLPLVTAVPAAVALQRQLTDAAEGRVAGPRAFARELGRSLRQALLLGVLAALAVAGFVVALPFWYAVPSWYGRGALVLLVFLLGLAVGVYLNLLCIADELRDGSWRAWWRPTLHHTARHPLPTLAATLVLVAWLFLVGRLPTLLLVGSGLVPAVAARWTLQRADAQASRS